MIFLERIYSREDARMLTSVLQFLICPFHSATLEERGACGEKKRKSLSFNNAVRVGTKLLKINEYEIK